MNNQYGIYEVSYNILKEELKKIREIESARIFGSRAMGNYKKGSDIDIAISGRDVTYDTVLVLSAKLNQETIIPYQIDVVDYNAITNPELKHHIDQFGKCIYKNNKATNISK